MDIAAAIACAAALMSLPIPQIETTLELRPDIKTIVAPARICSRVGLAEGCTYCAAAGRPGTCSGLEYGLLRDGRPWLMMIQLDPQSRVPYPEALMHAACHAVMFGNGLRFSGPAAERRCERIQTRIAECS